VVWCGVVWWLCVRRVVALFAVVFVRVAAALLLLLFVVAGGPRHGAFLPVKALLRSGSHRSFVQKGQMTLI
jgi:hypothetical protein